ncbi:hypothetical protein GCM10010961_32410 [Pseudodonghicola xiamenensis]|uniref:UDP-galactopyranose mutase C-terminal domain-containing protein n=1 Tax=Pseudodonghicola xiamenensis TaxID=337702 RepID=A0A8J3MFY1_9RHOB|nr:hypothetical protein GCM10010961_32410 [Pseudodonghicola xiamenensis]
MPYTRITEHKHFAPSEKHEGSVLYREFSRAAEPEDIPYYAIRQVEEKALLSDYVKLAEATSDVTFVGRLDTYRYLEIDGTIREVLDTARGFLARLEKGAAVPAFFVAPLRRNLALGCGQAAGLCAFYAMRGCALLRAGRMTEGVFLGWSFSCISVRTRPELRRYRNFWRRTGRHWRNAAI